ncbi:hypothetical protein JNB11_01275 [Kocuria palustris]|nr:hypothetical protein [Kocuria palustris]
MEETKDILKPTTSRAWVGVLATLRVLQFALQVVELGFGAYGMSQTHVAKSANRGDLDYFVMAARDQLVCLIVFSVLGVVYVSGCCVATVRRSLVHIFPFMIIIFEAAFFGMWLAVGLYYYRVFGGAFCRLITAYQQLSDASQFGLLSQLASDCNIDTAFYVISLILAAIFGVSGIIHIVFAVIPSVREHGISSLWTTQPYYFGAIVIKSKCNYRDSCMSMEDTLLPENNSTLTTSPEETELDIKSLHSDNNELTAASDDWYQVLGK